MSETDARFAKLRHDLANPLSAVLAEAPLLLLEVGRIDEETRRAQQSIKEAALKMRAVLRET